MVQMPDRKDLLDSFSDGDRQLTTDSDALETGLNDSDLGDPSGASVLPDDPTRSSRAEQVFGRTAPPEGS